MGNVSIVLVGLGPGSPDALTVGVVRTLREAGDTPIYLRTRIHPTVAWLEQHEGVKFSLSFDDRYDSSATFEDVYSGVADKVVADAQKAGRLIYVVPGHPLVGESSVALLLGLASRAGIDVQVVEAASFIESVLSTAKVEASQLNIVDALSLPDLQDHYHSYAPPFALDRPNLIYQVYDRDVASRVKLALLEYYPPQHEVMVVGADAQGMSLARRVQLSMLDWQDQCFDHLTTVFVAEAPETSRRYDFHSLLNVMAQLREPDRGCPWDREQTPQSVRKYLIEETYEVLDAIDSDDPDKYAEELGDLLLQVVLHAQLAREDALFSIDDVIGHIVAKLIRRHPHVFADVDVADSAEVLRNWEVIKRSEKGYEDRKSILDGVVRSLPALSRALEISKRAAKAGFEWESIEGVFDKLDEEVLELREARLEGNKDRIAEELGDLLFTVVNLARFEKVDAEDALHRMINRFIRRFVRIEDEALVRGLHLEDLTQSEMETIWQAAKREECY